VNPSTRIVANGGRLPKIENGAFVAPNASVVGDVKIGEGSSVWYGAVVRGKTINTEKKEFISFLFYLFR
jgi:carbonic anhydrase/acetyltransferase-like protein (isoleucine patch superfamily)